MKMSIKKSHEDNYRHRAKGILEVIKKQKNMSNKFREKSMLIDPPTLLPESLTG